jgi:hypothetical protein
MITPSDNRHGKFMVCFGSMDEAIEKYEKEYSDFAMDSNGRRAFCQEDFTEPFVFIRPDKEFSEQHIKY